MVNLWISRESTANVSLPWGYRKGFMFYGKYLGGDDYPRVEQEMDDFLYPHREPMPLKDITHMIEDAAHQTTRDKYVRQHFLSIIAEVNQELFNGLIAFHNDELAVVRLTKGWLVDEPNGFRKLESMFVDKTKSLTAMQLLY